MTMPTEAEFAAARQEMVEQIALHARLVSDRTGKEAFSAQVMDAMSRVPRHCFVPAPLAAFAYLNQPLPIGFGKTISQPFIVALMTDLLDVREGDRILEIGTGLGYQAAVLAELGAAVFSVDIIAELAEEAGQRLQRLGYGNVVIRVGDGSAGWREHAPFDRIVVTAAPELIPAALIEQLKPGGRMVIPAGLEDAQQLMLLTRDARGTIDTAEILPVRFTTLITVH